MLRSTLLIVAGILTTFAVACVPPPPPPPPATPVSPIADLLCSDETPISDKVVDLEVAYDPAQNDVTPPRVGTGDVSSYKALVQSAFNLATDDLRNWLCRLDHIYIDQVGPKHSVWGIRDRRNLKRHVGISKKLLDDLSGSSTPYAQYETEILHRLLWPTDPTNQPAWLGGLSYKTVTPDTLPIAVLAILAHEVGHTLWWNKGIPNLTCSGTAFHQITWRPPYRIPRGFHKFGNRQDNRPRYENFNIDDMVKLLRDAVAEGDANKLAQLSTHLKTVYNNENWVGLFAFVAPDEDFIETYKFGVLQNAGVTKMDLRIPGQSDVDVTGKFKNASAGSNIDQKKAWIREWLGHTGACVEPNGDAAHP